MSLPATIVLGIHLIAITILLSGPFQALLLRTASALPQRTALILSVIVLASGFNNFMEVMGSPLPKPFHMVFGIKFLLALHIIAVSIIASGKPEAKRLGLLQGAAYSGVAVILLSVYLGFIRTH